VGVKEPLGDAVRVFIVIDMLMVGTVLARPEEHGVFKGAGAEDQREQSHDGVRLESEVRKESMIAKCYRKAARAEHYKEECYLEPIDPEKPDINGHRCEREKQGADKERAGGPTDFLEWDS
jgi:hypothetical protein